LVEYIITKAVVEVKIVWKNGKHYVRLHPMEHFKLVSETSTTSEKYLYFLVFKNN
jgi:hypothetical protein